jgi:hypothetical protein
MIGIVDNISRRQEVEIIKVYVDCPPSTLAWNFGSTGWCMKLIMVSEQRSWVQVLAFTVLTKIAHAPFVHVLALSSHT